MAEKSEPIQVVTETWLTLTFSGPVTRESSLQAVQNLMFLAEKAKETPNAGIRMVINSPGGSILDGFMLFDVIGEIRENGTPVETGCYGMAASMGGVLLQAGGHRWMGRNAWLMLHNAAFGAKGKTYSIYDELELSERMEEQIIDIYVRRSGGKLTADRIEEEWFRKDWWITAPEALELGAIDDIRAGIPEQG